MFDLVGSVEGFCAIVFLARVLQLSNGGVIVPLELVWVAYISPMRGIARRRKLELESETGFNGGLCAKQGLLITVVARLLAVLPDFLRENLRQNKFPAHK